MTDPVLTALTDSAVQGAMKVVGNARVTAKALLREQGYRFTDAVFSKTCARMYPRKIPIPTPANTNAPPEPVFSGTLTAPDERRERTLSKTLVFTCAQSNTFLNDNFWAALQHYCAAKDADLHVSRFTYNKDSFGSNSVKPGSKKDADHDDMWYDPRILPFTSDSPLEITDDLVWCGELNILPTRITPLSSFTGYTRSASGIIPHAKMAMLSVPTMKGEAAKFLYTTGTVTQRNYIQKSAGQVADFHHVFGALIVEVDEYDNWWVRQLNADKAGCFYDLNEYWTPEGQGENERVYAITHGDLHMGKIDLDVVHTVFGSEGVVDVLQPYEQHFHDTVDFMPRNHHNIKDPHFLHAMHINGTSEVQQEFKDAAVFLLSQADREWSHNFIIVSNHDQAIETWLRNPAAMTDPVNARFWHEQNLKHYQYREVGEVRHPFRDIMTAMFPAYYQERCTFLLEDDSYKMLGEIEIGLHGHLGPNGARGNPKNLRTVGKANTAHTHSAGIIEGVYTTGVYGKMDMGYNKGLSSWSHSMVVTYPNAKRAILTIKDGGAWR